MRFVNWVTQKIVNGKVVLGFIILIFLEILNCMNCFIKSWGHILEATGISKNCYVPNS